MGTTKPKYHISKQSGEWIVVVRKTGLIIASFDHKHLADDYLAAQKRADEQSEVMSAYNKAALNRELMADFIDEFG